MDREAARELFSRYHDGDLSDGERRALEALLEEDPEARAEWETFRRTVEEISGLNRLQPPPSFAADVERKIRKRSRGRFFGEQRSFSLQFAVVSFILILLFMLAYLVLTATTEIELVEGGDAGAELAGEAP